MNVFNYFRLVVVDGFVVANFLASNVGGTNLKAWRDGDEFAKICMSYFARKKTDLGKLKQTLRRRVIGMQNMAGNSFFLDWNFFFLGWGWGDWCF